MTQTEIEILRHRYGNKNWTVEVFQPATSGGHFGRYIYDNGEPIACILTLWKRGSQMAADIAEMPQVIMRLCDEIERLKQERSGHDAEANQ